MADEIDDELEAELYAECLARLKRIGEPKPEALPPANETDEEFLARLKRMGEPKPEGVATVGETVEEMFARLIQNRRDRQTSPGHQTGTKPPFQGH